MATNNKKNSQFINEHSSQHPSSPIHLFTDTVITSVRVPATPEDGGHSLHTANHGHLPSLLQQDEEELLQLLTSTMVVRDSSYDDHVDREDRLCQFLSSLLRHLDEISSAVTATGTTGTDHLQHLMHHLPSHLVFQGLKDVFLDTLNAAYSRQRRLHSLIASIVSLTLSILTHCEETDSNSNANIKRIIQSLVEGSLVTAERALHYVNSVASSTSAANTDDEPSYGPLTHAAALPEKPVRNAVYCVRQSMQLVASWAIVAPDEAVDMFKLVFLPHLETLRSQNVAIKKQQHLQQPHLEDETALAAQKQRPTESRRRLQQPAFSEPECFLPQVYQTITFELSSTLLLYPVKFVRRFPEAVEVLAHDCAHGHDARCRAVATTFWCEMLRRLGIGNSSARAKCALLKSLGGGPRVAAIFQEALKHNLEQLENGMPPFHHQHQHQTRPVEDYLADIFDTTACDDDDHRRGKRKETKYGAMADTARLLRAAKRLQEQCSSTCSPVIMQLSQRISTSAEELLKSAITTTTGNESQQLLRTASLSSPGNDQRQLTKRSTTPPTALAPRTNPNGPLLRRARSSPDGNGQQQQQQQQQDHHYNIHHKTTTPSPASRDNDDNNTITAPPSPSRWLFTLPSGDDSHNPTRHREGSPEMGFDSNWSGGSEANKKDRDDFVVKVVHPSTVMNSSEPHTMVSSLSSPMNTMCQHFRDLIVAAFRRFVSFFTNGRDDDDVGTAKPQQLDKMSLSLSTTRCSGFKSAITSVVGKKRQRQDPSSPTPLQEIFQ